MDFTWGVATASYQIEGAWDEDGRGESVWDRFSHEPGNVKNGDTGDEACDHYHRFREDFLLAKELGHNAHRFGIEWSRLEKTEGKWDQSEWDHYKAVTDELLDLGIEPIVTLNHFTVPIWFARKGGWTNTDPANNKVLSRNMAE